MEFGQSEQGGILPERSLIEELETEHKDPPILPPGHSTGIEGSVKEEERVPSEELPKCAGQPAAFRPFGGAETGAGQPAACDGDAKKEEEDASTEAPSTEATSSACTSTLSEEQLAALYEDGTTEAIFPGIPLDQLQYLSLEEIIQRKGDILKARRALRRADYAKATGSGPSMMLQYLAANVPVAKYRLGVMKALAQVDGLRLTGGTITSRLSGP
jgi:hypothetical protein